MKKITILLSLLTIVGLLAACSTTTPAVNQSETSQLESSTQTGDVTEEFEVSLQTALIVGTFKLEGTENEITAEQASELLPLWMVLKNLLESDTAAIEEINALTNQISETMTAEQMAQINGLDLGQQSLRTLMEELGLSSPAEGTDGDGSQPGANRPAGVPAGMGLGGGQGGVDVSPEQMESFQATREAGGGGMGARMSAMRNTQIIPSTHRITPK